MDTVWKEHRKSQRIYPRKCPWRASQIAQAARTAGGRSRSLCHFLMGALILEAAVGMWRLGSEGTLGFRFVEAEREYRMEWITPAEAERESLDNIYGIRLRPDTWELQFYHRTEEIREKQ